MKKTILNIAAFAVIATTSFIACDKKAATDAAPAEAPVVDSTVTATEEVAPAAEATEAAPATEATEAAPAAETTEAAPAAEATEAAPAAQ